MLTYFHRGACKPPQELIDIVVDYIRNDYKILLNCSLASRLFLPSSRFHLFQELHLQASRCHLFFDLLESPLSTITHIQLITLDFEKIFNPDILSILTRVQFLRGLHSLSLKNLKIKRYVNLDGEITGFVDLKKLTITHSCFPDVFNMFNIISKFKGIEHLWLARLDFKGNPGRTPTDIGHLVTRKYTNTVPTWRILELYGSEPGPDFFRFLTAQPDTITLQTVVLTLLDSEDFIAAGKFLRVCSELKYLELQLAPSRLGTSAPLYCFGVHRNEPAFPYHDVR
jgi:hypothetical protein